MLEFVTSYSLFMAPTDYPAGRSLLYKDFHKTALKKEEHRFAE